ncbi:hypothetical protein [Halorubrum trueperi]|uniref:Uncharacterized protein n=1 Tax=Halorubrum trueperi TaxID=2004704 RepID=A0ABD5UPS0_9EURY
MAHDPLSPSEALRSPVGAAVAGVAVLGFVYSVVIVAQLVLGAIVGVGLTVGLYLTYRSLAVLDSLADAAQRIAAVREREVEERSGSSSGPVSRSGSGSSSGSDSTTIRDSSERVAERDR